MLITLEGGDGNGKSTQLPRIIEYIEQSGKKVVDTREPGGTDIGDSIRKILKDTRNFNMCPATELMLYAASRAQHIHEIIRVALDQGYVVVSDRFHDSSLAYQGYGRGVNLSEIELINNVALGGFTPDLTLLFDVPPEVGLERSRQEIESGARDQASSRFEFEKIDFHKKVRAGYLAIAANEPERFVIIDAAKSADDVFRQVQETLDARLCVNDEAMAMPRAV